MNATSDTIASIIKNSAESGNEVASFKVNNDGTVDIVTINATKEALQAPLNYTVTFTNENESVPIPNAVYNAASPPQALTDELKAVSALNNMSLTPDMLQHMPVMQDAPISDIGKNEQKLINEAASNYLKDNHISR